MFNENLPRSTRRSLLLSVAASMITKPGFAAETAEAPAASPVTIQEAGSFVETELRDDGVLLIALNRPQERNRVNLPMFLDLAAAYHRLETDEHVRCGVLYGRGNAFCVGLDSQEWATKLAQGSLKLEPDRHLNPVGTAGRLRTKPLVVAVHGATWMLGHELFLAADVRVAASDVEFDQGEVLRGLFPGGGGSLRFSQEAGRANAMRWMLTGETWGADEAYRMGLVQAVVPSGQHVERAINIAHRIATKAAPLGVQALLRSVNQSRLEGEQAAYLALLPAFTGLFRTEDFRERFIAAREQREPIYRGR